MPDSLRPRRAVPIILDAAAFTVAPVSRAAGLALPELGVAVFFLAGTLYAAIGVWAPWFVAAGALLGVAARVVDVESWSLIIPGGLVGRVRIAFGPHRAITAGAASLVERLLLAALSSVVAGHYAAALLFAASVGLRRRVTQEDLANIAAVTFLALIWLRVRFMPRPDPRIVVRLVWAGVAFLFGLGALAFMRIAMQPDWLSSVLVLVDPSAAPFHPDAPFAGMAAIAFGVGLALPAVGGGDSLSRVAGELERPRVGGLARAGRIVGVIGLLITTPLAFLFVVALPANIRDLWTSTPLVGLALNASDSPWLTGLLLLLLTATAMIWLSHATRSAILDADAQLSRLEHHGVVPEFLRLPYARFGTLTDTASAAVLLLILASSGRVSWLAIAYGVAIAATLIVKLGALVRLRVRKPGPSFRTPLNLKLRGREWPFGLWIIFVGVVIAAMALLAFGQVPAYAGVIVIAGVAIALTFRLPADDHLADAVTQDDFELAPSGELSLERIDARPGGLLVMVRNPHSLTPLASALASAGDRDVVCMTVRMLGNNAGEVQFADAQPTAAERELFSAVLALAERQRKSVRLLVVPAHDIIDAVVSAVLRLRSAELHVGESVSLSADAQARLVGDAWERAVKPEGLTTKLVIYHRSGRTDTFHLGAHVPALTTRDIDQIHAIWLDAVQGVGPHIHHADIVRAALTQMTDQLHGPDREEALRAIRRVAKPADELAAACQARDFSRLHDMVRNRPAQDVADALTELPIADQVVVYRMLPRKDAAATFEYLSHDDQTALLKAMAKDEVAEILNNMSPDDRTTLLEELPATVTRQMLELLSPEERAVAVKLLGYPESSVGRLMTPHYVRVREHWTVQAVLDHIRKHGQDSETLNVIYVVDEQGVLVDDVRIREFLLTDPGNKVSDLMDRHFVSLKATDDQDTAIAAFRKHGRTALPVTDSAGVLMGIVTIDDVLEVAEAKATNEIQRIGGSEALDEPYMEIGFFAMIRKRAGWLTALFLGEMLTATAMGAFEAEIAKAVVLAMFVPLIISSGGNAGSQASTLVIRALALGEVGLMDWWRVMRRELLAGLTLGSILGTIGFTRIALWSAFSTIYGEHWFLVAITVSLALIGIVLWGTVVGSVLPLILRRLGFDPATSSAPFVATLVDVTGLVIYFSVALVVLRGTLL